MYTSITVIFNPNSTGNAPEAARDFAKKLEESLQGVPMVLKETERAGHAEELAYEASMSGRKPLIVSASGDGGYNEVINGAMRAQEQGSAPICAVLPAGNANDHRRLVRRRPLVEAIVDQDVSMLDLLEVRWQNKRRYAHSYIGLGLTPAVAVELNRNTLNALKEMILVVKTYWQYQPFEIELQNKRVLLDSLVLANISGMAKILELSEDGKPTDGKFEIIAVPHTHRLGMIAWAVKAATVGLGKQPQASSMEFKTDVRLPMQLDGEVSELPAGSRVAVAAYYRVLRTIR